MKNRAITIILILGLLSLADFLIGDSEFFLLLNQGLSSPVLDFAFLYILVPLFLLLGIIPLLMLFFKERRFNGALALLGGLLCYWVGSLIKFSPRPNEILSGVNLVGDWAVGSPSFPSTTTMLAFGLTLPIFFTRAKFTLPLLFLAFLVGFFVVYSGYHFPEDVIAGAVFSLVIIFSLLQIKKIIKNLTGSPQKSPSFSLRGKKVKIVKYDWF